MLGHLKPGSRVLLIVGAVLWLLLTLIGQTPLERRLYDFQYVLAGQSQGPLAPSCIIRMFLSLLTRP